MSDWDRLKEVIGQFLTGAIAGLFIAVILSIVLIRVIQHYVF